MPSSSSSMQPRKTWVRTCLPNNLSFSSATTLELTDSPLQAVYIYFDTATYDEIERDEKVHIVVAYNKTVSYMWSKGDTWSPVGFDRRHNGTPHWFLHPQWNWDRLLPYKVSKHVEFFWSEIIFTNHQPSSQIINAEPINLTWSSGSLWISRYQELQWCLLSAKDLKTIWQGGIKRELFW